MIADAFVSAVTEPFPNMPQMELTGRRFGGSLVRKIMFSGRIGFVAIQQGLGLFGQAQTEYQNEDYRAAAEAANEILADPPPAKPSDRARHLFVSLLAAVF
ncbi:hypothetical protein [Dongia sp.]|uniref:hypothetical protein n=1 Tax=Dongia sp. TaxID=1977262 RepID=UPI0035AFBD32